MAYLKFNVIFFIFVFINVALPFIHLLLYNSTSQKKNQISLKVNLNINNGNSLCSWICPINYALNDTYLHLHIFENKIGEIFTTYALDTIVKELKYKFPNKPLDKEKIKGNKYFLIIIVLF